jgi:hypothetical protein
MTGEWQVGSGVIQGADSRPWNNLAWSGGAHPIAYAASGSHGLWGDLGDANNLHNYMITPTGEPLYDHTTQGLPWETWRHVVVISQQGQTVPWYGQYVGRWGEDPVTAGETSGGCTNANQGITDGRQDCAGCQGYDCSACQVAGMSNICANASLPGGFEFPGYSLCFGSDTEFQLNSGPFTPNGVRDVPTLPSRFVSLKDTTGANAVELYPGAFQPCPGGTAPTCPSANTPGGTSVSLAAVVPGDETLARASTFRIVPGLDPSVVDGVSIEAFTLEAGDGTTHGDDQGSIGNQAWFDPAPQYRYYLTSKGTAGMPVDVETDDGTPAFHDAATFKMHQGAGSLAAFESVSSPGAYLTGNSSGLNLAPSATDPVTSNNAALLFNLSNPLSSVQPGAYYHVLNEAPILTWNNGDNADWGCAALHVQNNTAFYVWITVYDLGHTTHYDYGELPPATEWTLTDGPCFAGYDWGSFYHVRAQVYPTQQDLQNDTNQVWDTQIEVNPQYKGAVLYAILAGAFILAPELTSFVIATVFAADGAVNSCDSAAASMMANFAIDALDSNGAATQKLLGAMSTSIDNLNNDDTSVGLWHGDSGNFYWTDPGFSP